MKRLIILLWLSLLLAGCASIQAPATVVQPITQATADLQSMAAAQATAILEQARATALVRQAETQAAAILQDVGSSTGTPAPLTPDSGEKPVVSVSPAGSAGETTAAAEAAAALEQAGSPVIKATPAPDDDTRVQIINVGFAADGGMIIVRFKAPPNIAGTFWPGRVSLTEEATGTVYDEVPVMPIIGPLIGRPVEVGQSGYVMFVNAQPGLPPGSLVTVILGDYTFEHIRIQ